MLTKLSLDLLKDLTSSSTSLSSVCKIDAADVFAQYAKVMVGIVTKTITYAYGHLE